MSCLEISPKEKLILRIRVDFPTKPIELHVQSTGVSEEEQIYFTEDDEETEEEIWQRKKQARDSPTHQLPDISFEKIRTHHSNYQKFSICQKVANTNTVAIEQNSDVILQQLNFKLQKEDFSQTTLLQDNRYQHYLRQPDRMQFRMKSSPDSTMMKRETSSTIKCSYPNTC